MVAEDKGSFKMKKQNNQSSPLLQGKEIEKEIRRRSSPYDYESISPDQEIPQGWNLEREYKTKKQISKPKDDIQKFNDEVWLLFARMGMPVISGSDFVITIEKQNLGISFHPAVVAQDDEIIFVVMAVCGPTIDNDTREQLLFFVQNHSLIRAGSKKY